MSENFLVYVVAGHDGGRWAYVGKGRSPARANASLLERGGDSVEIVAVGLTESVAFATETALIIGFRAAGVRLKNRVAGHGAGRLAPQLVGLASPAAFFPITRPTILVGTKSLRGGLLGPAGVRGEAEKFWYLDSAAALAVKEFSTPGGPGVDLLATPIGATAPIIIGAWPITGYDRRNGVFALGPARRIDAGLVAPVKPQQSHRYLAPGGGIGREPFLQYRRTVAA